MTITVRFFASIRERLGKSEAVIDDTGVRTVADVWVKAAGGPMPARLLAAVNLEHARLDSPVHDGDEIGFFPPVTGGQAMAAGVKVRVTDQPFDPWREIEDHRRVCPALAGGAGATTVFVGTMRDLSQGARVTAMTLEHYPGMTEKQLEAICREAAARWEILDTLVVHRHGVLAPDEPIVLVAVWAAHRDPAFDACRYIIDALKTRAPFWKREETESGPRWVEPESP